MLQADYRLVGSEAEGEWAPVCRGQGWLRTDELVGGATRGRLEPGDPRCDEPAAVPALVGEAWGFALVTEQWLTPGARVEFEVLGHSPCQEKERRERERAQQKSV